MIFKESINNIKSDEGGKGRKNLITRWLSWIFLTVSIVMLFYTYWHASINSEGQHSTMYFKYYVIFIVGILFWVGVLQLRADIRANIITMVISLVFGLYLIEGGLIFLGLGQPNINANIKD